MFPFRHSSIFRSRWIALLWAAGICWIAIDVASTDRAASEQAGSAGNAAGAAFGVDDVQGLEESLKAL